MLGAILMVAVMIVDVALSPAPLVLQHLACLARVVILICNYMFINEALHSWIPIPLISGGHTLRKSISSDAELIFLLSCVLYTVWQVLNTLNIPSGSDTAALLMIGILIGGGALARAFGASLLIWALNSAPQDQDPEEVKLRAMLTKWYAPPATDDSGVAPRALKGKLEQQQAREDDTLAPQQYLAAAAVATRLMVPDSLSRSMALRNLSSCGSVLHTLLKAALRVRQGSPAVHVSLIHLVCVLPDLAPGSCLSYYRMYGFAQRNAVVPWDVRIRSVRCPAKRQP
jgi:hypothetical protein